MSTRVAVVPSAPLLLPEYTGREDVGAGLRARAAEAVGWAGDGGDVVLVVATDREQRGTRPPLGQRVGTHFAGTAGVGVAAVVVVGWDASPAECAALGEHLAGSAPGQPLVVVADGSARRGEKAPGHLDERAFAVDGSVVAALRSGDLDPVRRLDPALCADLLLHGRAPLQVLAARSPGPVVPVALEADDPWGVLHVVARLQLPED
ncbi:hypothetical protein JQN72_01860 [Phycicoccus sp. CSK15P-2]|uniref:hypothetical protein n=1 Tax=Phycicoccus sp. CSK15P-2 TaxID=2807627 RepID=UPI00195106B9|nr:hypothetical protein [Phycicoccus sp. CSK15P-2]MBM6402993.1 hypothetical protein [Phycicoccus sp. CSK15P-2]